MHWLLAVVIGHLLNSVSFVMDKVLLTKSIKNPFAFTFFIGVLGLGVLALVPFADSLFGVEMLGLLPFDFMIPGAQNGFIDIVTGILFTLALLFFFLALQGAEASRIVPFIGGSVPIFTWVFEFFVLDTVLSAIQFIGFAILVIGTVLIALDIDHKEESEEKPQGVKAWIFGLLAGVAFALSFGFTKIAFDSQEFWNAFIWMRFGSVLPVFFFLFHKKIRKAIIDSFSMFKEKAGFLYLIAQGFGGGGFIFINYAISIASVSLVNALQGIQYAFLLLLAVLASIKSPDLLKESMSRKGLILKVIATGIIGVGLYIVAVNS